MTPAIRKANLAAHITFSVAWMGAVAAFLALSVAGLTCKDVEAVRGAYLAMNLICVYIIFPLSLAALLTGLIQSLGTHWGLFRYYWVLTKFLLTILATIALLMHQLSAVARAAKLASETAAGTLESTALVGVGNQLATVASAAVVLLLVLTILSVYKPWGLTPYGRRKQEQEMAGVSQPADNDTPLGLKVFLTVTAVLVAGFLWLHLMGHSLHHGH